jgi:predicted porin
VAGNIEKLKLYAEYHVIESDKPFDTLSGGFGDKYGREFDASVSYPVNAKLNAKLEYAKFSESDVYGATAGAAVTKGDKEIIWLTALYTF